MIIYLDEDRSYLSWVFHHRDGFVIDWLRQPTKQKPVLHRATCKSIRVSPTKKTHWTTGRHIKACSLDRQKLQQWAEEESGHAVVLCEECLSGASPADDERPGYITKLGRELLDFVLETAVVHLDNQAAGYRLTVGDLADSADKTTGQIAAALWRLIQGGYVQLNVHIKSDADLSPQQPVFPTVTALQTLPDFSDLPSQEIESELELLRGAAD